MVTHVISCELVNNSRLNDIDFYSPRAFYKYRMYEITVMKLVLLL